jgi:hypothetical protein
MKKLISLMATLLSLVLMVAPLSAGAEIIDVGALQISDPVISYNGETMIDLTGLTLQLSGGSTADGAITQLMLNILGGGNLAGSALVQVDDNGIAGYVGGMSQAYGIPMETLEARVAELGSSMNDQLGGLAAMGDDWTLPEDIIELIADYMGENAVIGEETPCEVELSTGAATGASVSLSADLNALMPQIMAMVDADPLMTEMLRMLNENGSVSAESWDELCAVTSVDWQLTGSAIDGDNFDGGKYTVNVSDGSETISLTCDFFNEYVSDSDSITHLYMTLAPSNEEFAGQSVYLTIDSTVTGDDFSSAAHAGYNFGDDEAMDISLMCSMVDGSFTAMLNDSTGTVNVYCSATDSSFTLSATAEGAELFSAYANWSDSAISAGLTGDGFGNLELAFTPAGGDNITGGDLDVNYTDAYGDNYAVACALGILNGSVDTADTYISPDVVVDVTSIDEEQASAIQEELMMAMQSIMTSLMQTVPGLQALISG